MWRAQGGHAREFYGADLTATSVGWSVALWVKVESLQEVRFKSTSEEVSRGVLEKPTEVTVSVSSVGVWCGGKPTEVTLSVYRYICMKS